MIKLGDVVALISTAASKQHGFGFDSQSGRGLSVWRMHVLRFLLFPLEDLLTLTIKKHAC